MQIVCKWFFERMWVIRINSKLLVCPLCLQHMKTTWSVPFLMGAVLFYSVFTNGPLDQANTNSVSGHVLIYIIQSHKSSYLNFYIWQGLSRLVLQPKFLFDQGRAAVGLDMEMCFADREMSPRHRSPSIQPLGFPVDLAKNMKLFNTLPILYQLAHLKYRMYLILNIRL